MNIPELIEHLEKAGQDAATVVQAVNDAHTHLEAIAGTEDGKAALQDAQAAAKALWDGIKQAAEAARALV